MFNSYDLSNFGNTLKQIRENLGYSRLQVSDNSGVHIDTIRKIEQGLTIPKYETLEILSPLYKTDLLTLLSKQRYNKSLYQFYKQIDSALINDDVKTFQKVQEEIKTVTNDYKLIFNEDFQLLKLFLDSAYSFHRNQKDEFHKFIDTIEKFTYFLYNDEPNESKFNPQLLIRIENIHAFMHMRLKNYNQSIGIIEKLLSMLKDYTCFFDFVYQYEIKLLYSLSYCQFMRDNYFESLNAAIAGIQISKTEQSLYMLYHLYARKGASEYHLGIREYRDSFIKCIHLIDICGDEEIREKYMNTIRKRYIPDFFM